MDPWKRVYFWAESGVLLLMHSEGNVWLAVMGLLGVLVKFSDRSSFQIAAQVA